MATLQILVAAATNAIGRPKIAVRTGLFGAAAMAAAFIVGIGWGAQGLALAWIAGVAALLAATILMSLPAIGATRPALAAAVGPGLSCALVMAAAVAAADAALPPLREEVRLALLVAFGAAVYAASLFLFARPVVDEVLALVRPRARRAAAA
jgi:hypothetical protein